MVELRWVRRMRKIGGNAQIYRVLQYRYVPLQIGWLKSDDAAVIQPVNPVNLIVEKNWTEWQDVPESDAEVGG